MHLPQFGALSTAYPDYWSYPTPEAAQALIGGEVLDPDITNTCAIRMSHAMNGVGMYVPRLFEGITNRRGANDRYYIIRVKNFRSWMHQTFGAPTFWVKKREGTPFDRSQIEGFKGVIGFEIGFGDATGHFDLWFGDRFSHEGSAGKDYFTLATYVTLWHDGTRTVSPPV